MSSVAPISSSLLDALAVTVKARAAQQQHRLRRFALRQQSFGKWQGKWIAFLEIAEWFAREGGSILADKGKREQAYRKLCTSLIAGEFEHRGRSLILLLNPERDFYSPTTEAWQALYNGYRHEFNLLIEFCLQWCWAPRELVRQWFTNHRLTLPPNLAVEAPTARGPRLRTPDPEPSRPALPVTSPGVVDLRSQPTDTASGSGTYQPDSSGRIGVKLGNPRGPRPTKRDQIVAQMMADFADDAPLLDSEKEETLSSKYEASRDTVRKARNLALGQMNFDKPRQIPTIDK